MRQLGTVQIPVSYTHLDVYKRQIQEVVVSSSRTMMSGTSTSAAPTTSLTTSFCTLAVLAALPDMAPPSPCLLYTSRCV